MDPATMQAKIKEGTLTVVEYEKMLTFVATEFDKLAKEHPEKYLAFFQGLEHSAAMLEHDIRTIFAS
jgi:hypothetical protein